MTDTLTHYKPLDPGRVDTLDEVEMLYWSKELHCTLAELTQAVAKVGEHITAVREYLAAHR